MSDISEPAPAFVILKRRLLDHIVGMYDDGLWINADWVRFFADRPPGCMTTLKALEELEAEGLIEALTDWPKGSPRRLGDDFKATEKAMKLTTYP